MCEEGLSAHARHAAAIVPLGESLMRGRDALAADAAAFRGRAFR